MSDYAAPLLVVLRDEAEAFWAFVALMDRVGGCFDAAQAGMHAQLAALRSLMQVRCGGVAGDLRTQDPCFPSCSRSARP